MNMTPPVPVSLDFLYLALWSAIALSVVLHYLTRLGSIPLKVEAGQDFASNYGLTPRETEVLSFIIQGLTNKEIGEKLFISFTTVRTHVSHIFEKTGVKNRVELVSLINRS
jgi:DNA-binding NarL/FixJ family response regulator